MAAGKDNLFGIMAERLNYVSAPQVKECLAIQQKMRGMGIEEPLGEIMTKKGYITEQQARAVLRAMGITTEQIPGYQLITKIGQGGMGTVYKATQSSMNRTVAIKVLSSLMMQDPAYVARFLAEGRAAAALSHKNIILAIDAGEANGNYFFVMEYFPGESLREIVVAKGICDEARAIDVARQVAEALDYLHQRKMIHRDIKPENVMIGQDAVVKICDFGLARHQHSEQSLTQTGYAVGTPYYMSPEQVTGEKDVDIRADLYSLGATLYYAVTGRFVFEGNTAAETMSMHLNQPVTNPKQFAPKLSEHFVHVIYKLLEKNRAQRYQTPHELIEDLDRLRAGEAPQHAQQHASARIAKSHHHTRAIRRAPPVAPLAIGLTLAVAVIGLIVVVSNGRDEPPAVVAPPPPRPAPPPPPPAAPDPPPKVDQDREDRAGILFERARKEFDWQRWKEAKATLEKLRRDFDGTQLLAAKRADVVRMIGVCESHLEGLMRTLDRRHDEARAQMRPGTWTEARDALLSVKLEGVETARVKMAGLDEDIAACDSEISAESAHARIAAATKEQRWDAVIADAADFRRQYGRTTTGRAVEGDVTAWTTKAQLELDAQKALADAKLAALAGNWDEVMKVLEAMERAYHATKTYESNQGPLERLRQDHMKAKKAEMEADARTSWSAAERDFKEALAQNKFETAEQALRAWEQKYKLTDEYQNRLKTAVQIHLKTLTSTRAKLRDGEAQEHWKTLKDAMTKRLWDDGYRAAEILLRDYVDTRTVKDNTEKLRAMKATCEAEGGIGPHVVWRLEFEEEKDALQAMGDGKPRFDWTSESWSGRRAGSVAFAVYESGEYSWLVHEINRGLPAAAESITVMLKSGKRSATVRLVVAEFNPTEEFVVDFATGSDWKRHTVKLADMKKQWGEGGNGKLDAERVRRIGFAQREKNEAQEYYVDALRVEVKK